MKTKHKSQSQQRNKGRSDTVFAYEPFPPHSGHSNEVPRVETSYADTEKAKAQANRAILQLRAAATAGDDWALRCLVELFIEHVDWLEDFTGRNLKLVQSIASKTAVWPVLASLHPHRLGHRRPGTRPGYIEKLCEALQLGSESGISCHRKSRWGIDPKTGKASIATAYAYHVVNTITTNRWLWETFRSHATWYKGQKHIIPDDIPLWVKNCETLKPFSKQTADAWFEVGRSAIMEATNNHPERIPALGKLGKHREFHQLGKGGHDPKERTRNANVQDGIFAAIKQALEVLAPPS
ncbi:MAG: hypothetical protein ABSA12_06545 [Verrucomicrobiia bacterium]